MLAVEGIRYYRSKRDLHLYRPLDQLQGNRWLGTKLWIGLTFREVVSGSVGLDLQRIVGPLVRPKRTYRYYAIVYLADAAQVLLLPM